MIAVEIVVAQATFDGSMPCALASGYSEWAFVIPVDDALVTTFKGERAKEAGPVIRGGLRFGRAACTGRGMRQPDLRWVMLEAVPMAALLWTVAALGIAALWWLT